MELPRLWFWNNFRVCGFGIIALVGDSYPYFSVIMTTAYDAICKQGDLSQECYKIFKDMRQKKEFCDVTLNIGNHSIHAHKVILAASIPYFRSFSCNETEIQKKEILMDVSPVALEALIDFAYTFEVNITSENVQIFLTAACFLGMDYVKKACVEFLVKELTPKNAVSFRETGIRLNCQDLISKTDDYIKKNFDSVSECDGFLFLPCSYLKDLISSDNLHVTSEEKVFEGMIRWIKAQPNERSSELPLLLRCVRMPFVKLQYFGDVIARDELIRRSLECRDILDDARDYHLFLEKKSSAKGSWSFVTAPRQYMNFRNEDARSVMPEEFTLSNAFMFCDLLHSNLEKYSGHGTDLLSSYCSGIKRDRQGYNDGFTEYRSTLCHYDERLLYDSCNIFVPNHEKSYKVPCSDPQMDSQIKKATRQYLAPRRLKKESYNDVPLAYVKYHPSIDASASQNLIKKIRELRIS